MTPPIGENHRMRSTSIASIAVAVGFVVASCAGSSDAPTIGNDAAGQSPTGITGVDAVSAPVSIQFEQRLGAGRAVAAASNEAQTVVATTVDIVVGPHGAGPFRSIAPSDGSIREVGISPVEDRIAVLAANGELEVWTTDENPALTATSSAVTDAQFRPDGSLVVATSGALRVLDTTDATVLEEWTAPSARAVGLMAVADDGSVVVSLDGAPTPEIAVWSGGADAFTFAIESDLDIPHVTRVTATGDRVGLGLRSEADGFDARIAVYPMRADEPLWVVDAEGDSWDLRADGGLVVGDASTLRVIDDTGVEVASLPTPAPVERVVDGGLVVLANGSIMRLDERNALDEVIEGNVRIIDLDDDPASGVTTFVDATGRVGRIDDDAVAADVIDDFVAAPINDVAVAADGRVATASTNGVVEIRDGEAGGDGSEVTQLVHDEGNVDSVAFAADGSGIATGVAQRRAATAFDDTVSLWPADGGDRVFEIGGEAEDVDGCSFFTNRLRYAPDASFVVSTSHDFTVTVIATPTGELLHTFPPHANSVLDVAISPDGSKLVTSGDDSTMRVWDLTTYELIADHPTTMGGYWSLSFLPDGESVIAGDLSGNLSLVDVTTGAPTVTFEGTKLRQARTAVSPDDRLVAAGSDDSTVRLWSTATGEMVGDAAGHGGAVSSVAFFADSERFASASGDGTAIVWRVAE